MTSHQFRFFMDARYTRTDFHDGISRFGSSLIEAVAAQHDDLTMIISDEGQLNLLPQGVGWIKVTGPTSPAEPFVASQINAHHPDVVFSPMQTMGSAGRNYGLILTLHDLIYYQHRTPPRNLPAPIRGLWRLYHLAYWPQRVLLNRADAVATVSRTTQRLMRTHRLTTRPIHVISNAAPTVDTPRDPHIPPAKSLVYMGSFMEYKNVEDLIRGMERLPDYKLHLLSKITDQRRHELATLAADQGVGADQIVFHNGTSEEEYQRLLREATALVTLSEAEGFGLPLVEAMSHGTPVILSDTEIFREIGGPADEAARFVESGPSEAGSQAARDQFAAHVRALENPETFAAASRAALAQAGRFTWEESATALLDLASQVHVQHSRRRRR